MSEITIYKYKVAEDGEPVLFDVKSTTNPLVAEKRYLRRCIERTEDKVWLVIKSEHPLVSCAKFLLQKSDLSNFDREQDPFRKYCFWTYPERCVIDLGKQWEAPTWCQMRALKECILQDGGGEISTADLAIKYGYHKRTFAHYFSEVSDRKAPFVVFRAIQRLAGFPIDEIKVAAPIKSGRGHE